MNRRHASTRSVAGLVLGLVAFGPAAPASAQSAPVYRPTAPDPAFGPPARRYYQPAAPGYPVDGPAAPGSASGPAPRRYYQPSAPTYRERRGGSALPYNRSPYTDDWSTSRHLPFPKPWMLPTRDPAYRGR